MGFLKRHYEKILLGLLLAVFIGLLAFQLVLWQQNQEIKVEKMKGFKDPEPNYTRIDFTTDKSPFRVLQNLPNKPFWAKATSRENIETFHDFSDIMKPFPLAICPYCLRVIPAKAFPTGEGAGACMFCKKTLHHPYSAEAENANKDTDGDGIPDKDEVKLGLNPDDPTDAKVDTDGDYFSNYEEFISKTDYRNPKSRPPYHEKLYLLDAQRPRVTFKVNRIKYKDNMNKTKAGAEIEVSFEHMTQAKRKRVKIENFKIGRLVSSYSGTYKIVDLQIKQRKGENNTIVDDSVVVVQKDGLQDKLLMKIGETVYEPLKAILSINMTGKVHEDFNLSEKSKFNIGTEKTGIDSYSVVRIVQDTRNAEKSTVTIRSEKDGKEYQIGTISALDRHIDQIRQEKAKKARRQPAQTENANR